MILITGNISIFCYRNAGFVFKGIKRLTIKGLKLIGCSKNKVKLVAENFLLEKVSFVGENKSETALSLEIDKSKVCIIDTSFCTTQWAV